jgi:hypothetical protein
MNNSNEILSGSHTKPAAVQVCSKGLATAGLLLRDDVLDADGATVSLLGCKSGIVGRKVGEAVLVRLTNGETVPARITHIHAKHDRFRAEIDPNRLPACLALPTSDHFVACAPPLSKVIVLSPFSS